MPRARGQFRNVILCEDVRDEIGRKKSLMGVYSGDVIVAKFPARVQLAAYIEYIPTKSREEDEVSLSLYLDDEQIARGAVKVKKSEDVVSFVMPKTFLDIKEDGACLLKASINGAEPEEILRKKIFKGEIQPR